MNPAAPTETTKVGSRKLLFWLAVIFFVVALPVGIYRGCQWRFYHVRAAWKVTALQRLAGLSITNESIRRELVELKGSSQSKQQLWAGDQVILMTNGEYVIYAFWHGANNGFVDHLFLGHGSDGRWLYSTYHFCNGMAGVEPDQPASINDFMRLYGVREFDGKSDVCLRHTWPVKKID